MLSNSSQECSQISEIDLDEAFKNDKVDKFDVIVEAPDNTCVACLKRASCFVDYSFIFALKKPNCWQICCWRYFKSRQNSLLFKTSEGIRHQINHPYQRCLIWHMVVNYVFLLLCLVSLFIKVEKLMPMLYLAYTFLFETAVSIKIAREMKFKNTCCYVTVKILSGLLTKLVLLVQAAFSVFLYQHEARTVAFLLAAFLLASQYASVRMMLDA